MRRKRGSPLLYETQLFSANSTVVHPAEITPRGTISMISLLPLIGPTKVFGVKWQRHFTDVAQGFTLADTMLSQCGWTCESHGFAQPQVHFINSCIRQR